MIHIVVSQLLMALVGIIIGTPILMLAAKILKVKGNFKTALIVNLVSQAISFILGLIFGQNTLLTLVGLVVVIFLIKKMYELEWGKAIVLWLVWAVTTFVIMFVVGLVIGLLGLAALFSLAS